MRPNQSPRTCYGCIHLKYRGPVGVLPDEEISPEDMGDYICRSITTSDRVPVQICDANLIPRPIGLTCKETR